MTCILCVKEAWIYTDQFQYFSFPELPNKKEKEKKILKLYTTYQSNVASQDVTFSITIFIEYFEFHLLRHDQILVPSMYFIGNGFQEHVLRPYNTFDYLVENFFATFFLSYFLY